MVFLSHASPMTNKSKVKAANGTGLSFTPADSTDAELTYFYLDALSSCFLSACLKLHY